MKINKKVLTACSLLILMVGCDFTGSGNNNSSTKEEYGELNYILSNSRDYYIVESVKDKNITEIEIPTKYKNKEVKEIGEVAFRNCHSLVNISIPSSVTTIGDYAFTGCDSLTNIAIPSSVISIGEYAFDKCTSLQYSEYDNGLYLGNEENQYFVLLQAKETNIVSFSINNNTKLIADRAFDDCSSLTSITIPSSITTIGVNAFSSCGSLINLYYSGTIEDWCNITLDSFGSNPMKDESHFYMLDENNDYKEITSIEIPSTVTSIGNYQFYRFNNISSITIPNGVTSIGDGAFNSCGSLINISIPRSVTSIEYNAFFGCDSLQYNEHENGLYLGNDENPYLILAKVKDKSITSFIINENTRFIHTSAFFNCSSLISVTIPRTITSVGSSAFSNCSSLTNVYYEGTIEDWCDIVFFYHEYQSNPMSYASHFYMLDESNNYKEVTNIEIPSTVTSIGDHQFSGFNNVTSIVVPSSITTIGRNAFSDCTSLQYNEYENGLYLGNDDNPYLVLVKEKDKSITSCIINEKSELIHSEAFSECDSLKNIVLPNNMKSIGEYAFSGCSSLISITIPRSVISIGRNAFIGCIYLMNVYYGGTIEDWDNIKFDSSTSSLVIYVPHFYAMDENNQYKEVLE